MATKFVSAGWDETQDGSLFVGLNTGTGSTATYDSSQAHDGTGSIKCVVTVSGQTASPYTPDVVADAGSCISAWFRFSTVTPATLTNFLMVLTSGNGSGRMGLGLNTNGTVNFANKGSASQANGSTTLTANTWYRISLSYTDVSTSTWAAKVYINGVLEINASAGVQGNGSANSTASVSFGQNVSSLGSFSTPGVSTVWVDSIYIDDRTDLTDCGDIRVTAKRPFSNGTTNGFTTQIGSGGSGYGSGHTPQVNERPLSTTNGWSMVGAGSAITEEYTLESSSAGDVDISTATIKDYVGWVYAKALASETASIIVGGSSSNVSLTSTSTMFTKAAGSTTYPSTAAAIGIVTTTALTTVSLYEAGILVAYISGTPQSKTQSAKARISKGITKTQTSTARITKVVTKTQTAVARISKSFTKTQSSVARIVEVVAKTQSAKSRISATVTKTQSAKARISKGLTLTQSAKANILAASTTTKTQTAKARIQKQITFTQAAKGRVQVVRGGGTGFHFIQTKQNSGTGTSLVITLNSAALVGDLIIIDIKAVAALGSLSVTDNASVPNVYAQAATFTSNFSNYQFYGVQVTGGATTITLSWSGSTSVRATADEFSGNAPSNAKVFDKAASGNGSGTTTVTTSVAISPSLAGSLVVAGVSIGNGTSLGAGTNYVIGTNNTSGATTYRLAGTTSETAPLVINGTSITYDEIVGVYLPANIPGFTQTALARIQKTLTKTQAAVARITKTVTKTQSAKGRVQKTVTLTQTTHARITATPTKTQTARARVTKTITKTQTAVARVVKTFAKTQSAVARIIEVRVKTQSALGRIQKSFTKTQSAKARISKTITKTQTATARIVETRTKTQAAVARLRKVVTKTQAATARIAKAFTLTQSTKARIVITKSKTQTAVAHLVATRSKTQTAKATIKTTASEFRMRPTAGTSTSMGVHGNGSSGAPQNGSGGTIGPPTVAL